MNRYLKLILTTLLTSVCPAAVVGCGLLLDESGQPGVVTYRGDVPAARITALEARLDSLEQRAAIWASGATLLANGVSAGFGAVNRARQRPKN